MSDYLCILQPKFKNKIAEHFCVSYFQRYTRTVVPQTLKTTRFVFSLLLQISLMSEECRSNCLEMFSKIGVLKNVATFTGKHLCWSLFLIKLED